MDRRKFMKGSAALGLAMAPAAAQQSAAKTAFWPNGARFVVSLSATRNRRATGARR